jgi:beta-glucosidase
MMLSFPDGFLWGAATSSHQVEGDNFQSDWADWEKHPGKIHDGTRAGHAAGWWAGSAERDLSSAHELGHNAHRSSLEWSRLEPEPGAFDDRAFARYAEMLGAARERGLATLVTLNHFTLPRWLARNGSWLAPDAAERFVAFARASAERLGELVDLWATLNEPSVLAYMGYAGRSWPPGSGSIAACYRALGVMLEAHARTVRALRERRGSAPIGLVLNIPVFDPAGALVRDRLAAGAQDWAFNGVVLYALAHGVFMPPLSLRPKRIDGLRRAYDWIGLNYYGRYRVAFDPRAAFELFGRRLTERNIRTKWTDWGELHPEGLTRQLLRLAKLGVPVYVTENGVFDNEDRVRARVIVDHVRAVHAAIRRGADVRGYFHWSLIDNFEWAEGWATHFGLIELDRETGARRKRASADVYAAICRANAVSD